MDYWLVVNYDAHKPVREKVEYHAGLWRSCEVVTRDGHTTRDCTHIDVYSGDRTYYCDKVGVCDLIFLMRMFTFFSCAAYVPLAWWLLAGAGSVRAPRRLRAKRMFRTSLVLVISGLLMMTAVLLAFKLRHRWNMKGDVETQGGTGKLALDKCMHLASAAVMCTFVAVAVLSNTAARERKEAEDDLGLPSEDAIFGYVADTDMYTPLAGHM